MRAVARLGAMRARAESRMLSTATIRRPTGDSTTDPETGFPVPEWGDVHVGIPFRLDGGSNGDGGSKGVTVGGVTYEQATAVGHLPASTVDLADDDVLVVMSGEWPGTFWTVVAAVTVDQKTARRIPLAETQQPKGWV